MNTWPVLKSYDAQHLLRIAMPLGGIGTGTVSLGGRGDLRDWEIMNRPAKHFVPAAVRNMGPFFAVRARSAGGEPVMRALEGPLDTAEYDGDMGSYTCGHGLARFRDCRFEATYPLAQVVLSDPMMPLKARLEAFNPLVPEDADRSGLPVAMLRYVIENTSTEDLDVTVCGSLPNFIGIDGSKTDVSWTGKGNPVGAAKNRNRYRDEDGLRGLFMDSEGVADTDPAWGTLALLTPDTGEVTYREAWRKKVRWGGSLLDFLDDLREDGRLDPRDAEDEDSPLASLALSKTLPAGSSAEFVFVLGWHFPNRYTWTPKKCECACEGDPNMIGNYYCTRFGDAWMAAAAFCDERDVLEEETVAFVGSICASDLPETVKEAALFNLSTLRTQTCFRTPDGYLYGWEGCCDGSGCCYGSCTHVWNYEQATAFLFGDLARGMREVEFLHATNHEGRMSFRVNLPISRASESPKAAADGQMGCLMKLYREWKLCGDDAWLKKLWPKAKKTLAYCWIPGGWDADRDGVMEGCQHNTMDVEYFGPNPQMTGWYLGALKACAEMAAHLGDEAFATECRELFASGSAWMDEHLFNGSYYEHEIRPVANPDAVPPDLYIGMGGDSLTTADYQLGAGCLVDQLVGQYMAHVCGLGHLHDPDNVKTTLRTIYTENRKTDFHGHWNIMRSYVLGGESALLMASYPQGRRPECPFPYFTEVMTGFEYTAAVGMLYEGQEAEALQCIDDIRARYDGKKRNPFDEAECGRHYARAMASWAALLAWTGFDYSAVEKTLTLASRPGRFFWSTGTAWGTYTLAEDGRLELEAGQGTLALDRLRIGTRTIDCTGTTVAPGTPWVTE